MYFLPYNKDKNASLQFMGLEKGLESIIFFLNANLQRSAEIFILN